MNAASGRKKAFAKQQHRQRRQPTPAATSRCYRCGYPWHGHGLNLGPYNKWCLRRWAAGVVACFVDRGTGEPCLLLGKELRQDGGYNVFWGFGELAELTMAQTAARECSEETLGLLGSTDDLTEALQGCQSLDNDGSLYVVFLGLQAADELVDKYNQRHRRWLTASACMQPLAPPKLQPGGDVMERLLAVQTRHFWEAATGLGGAPELRLHAASVFCCVENCWPGTNHKVLQPRPPVEMLVSVLLQSQCPVAEDLRIFFQHGQPSSLWPCLSTLDCRPIPGVTTSGAFPDGSALASQTIFSATWTGGSGTKAAVSTWTLAIGLARFAAQRSLTEADMQAYAKAWVARALDSPAVASLACAHLAACLQHFSEHLALPLAWAWVEQLASDMRSLLSESAQRANGAVDGAQLTIAYRWLCGLQHVRQVEEALASSPRRSVQDALSLVERMFHKDEYGSGGKLSDEAARLAAQLQRCTRPRWLNAAACDEATALKNTWAYEVASAGLRRVGGGVSGEVVEGPSAQGSVAEALAAATAFTTAAVSADVATAATATLPESSEEELVVFCQEKEA